MTPHPDPQNGLLQALRGDSAYFLRGSLRRQARRNLFFRPTEFVAEALGRDSVLVLHVLDFLQDVQVARQAAAQQPLDDEALRERMGAVDLLESIAGNAIDGETRQAASDALAALVRRFPSASPAADMAGAGLLRADRADALTAVTHLDPERALALLADVSEHERAVMWLAVVSGLIDMGYSRRDAMRLAGPVTAG